MKRQSGSTRRVDCAQNAAACRILPEKFIGSYQEKGQLDTELLLQETLFCEGG
jgi:hypothetical protein